jgi:hypothetical protein
MTAAAALIRLFATTVAVWAVVAAFNFVVDPLQLFGRHTVLPVFYTSNDREQAAGLIQSQDFDTVFMGTSLAIHFRASEISRQLGGKVVKLALAGSNSVEQSFVLEAAMARKPARVLWQMDDWIFRNGPDIDAYLPTDYYRRNLKGFAKYLLSLDTARESLGIVARSVPALEGWVKSLTWIRVLKFADAVVDDINSVPANYDVHRVYNSAGAWASFAYYKAHPEELSSSYDYSAMVRNFEYDAFDLIARHPEVRFTIYFTPYSILHFVVMRDYAPNMLAQTYRFSAYVMTRLSSLPNVTMFDFRDAAEITHDLENYSDLAHHSPDVDAEILRRLARGQNKVAPDEPLASLRRLEKQVADYQMPD